LIDDTTPGPWFWLSYCPQMHVAHDPLTSSLNPMCPIVTHVKILNTKGPTN